MISIYLAELLNIKIKKDFSTIVAEIITIATIVLIIINHKTGFIFTLSPDGKYIPGKQYYIIYIVSLLNIFLDIYYFIKTKEKLETKETVSYIFTLIILIACCIADQIYTQYLITDMFFIFVLIILYLAFEYPDIFIDKKTELFNSKAFYEVLKENFYIQNDYSVVYFTIKNYAEKKRIYGTNQIYPALKEIGKFLLTLPKNKKCFYLQNGHFAILTKSTNDTIDYINIIEYRFLHPWIVNNSALHLNIIIANTNNKIIFKTPESVLESYRIALEKASKKSATHITITNREIEEIDYKTKVTKALHTALQDDNLQVYFQPIIDSSTRKIIAAEALVRLFDNELGLIPPVEFITMAEKNGSIEQLGEQVLNKVCCFLKETSILNYGIQWINVNLSPIQCQNNSLPEKLDKITKLSGIDHKYIHLEITEEAMIDAVTLKRQMEQLRVEGYEFALDDFGTGFANIAKLKTFPFNNIKLDMSIVHEHFNSPDEMLPCIIRTFNSRGLTVTAEGIETKEMADALEKMGCNYFQGFYFSKPIPASDFYSLVVKSYKKQH